MPIDAKSLIASLPDLPGVYRMIDAGGTVLYVGKAKSLKKRVSSYFQKTIASPRIALMVSQIEQVDITTTRSEAEALLLENNLIKRLSPRFNIVFRDDKSYPYILITRDDTPRLGFFRGTPDRRGEYYGPYPSASAVRASLHLLQKMFRLRSCEDSVFANRSRPCLLYQIQRCSGPCVEGLISAERYQDDVRLAKLFLAGRSQDVVLSLTQKMEAASIALAFEQAAIYRDQIQALAKVRDRQYVSDVAHGDVDIIVGVELQGTMCINLAMVRGGQHLGDKPMFPEHAAGWSVAEAIASFIGQHYAVHPAPTRIVVNAEIESEVQTDLIELAGRPVPVSSPRGETQRAWTTMAEQNALLALKTRQGSEASQLRRQEALRQVLGMSELPARIECFDISHTQGEAPVASCVVYQGNGMKRSEYRRFNIRDVTPGDDYAAIRQAVSRRYDGLAAGEGVRPDLILIDGGRGQVSMAHDALTELGLGDLPLLGVSKGEERKAGLEKLIRVEQDEPLQLEPDHPALHLIQEIRDEAHRFAVAGHRARRGKTRRESRLEGVAGIGPTRRKALIAHFGSLQGVREATIEQLADVPGISRKLAEDIFQALRQ